MSARALLIGLDGADLAVIEQLGPAVVPHLDRLMAQGVYAPLQSVRPPATLPNWTTCLTGVNPAKHGVFDFTTRRGYEVRFTAGTVRETPTLVSRLDRMGMTTACVSFPATWPPERLERGVFISGWDSPVAFEADRSFVWPSSLYDEIVSRFGPPRFDDVDEFAATEPGWHAALAPALCRRIDRKLALGRWLLDRKPWDLFCIYFGESDTAAHHLWSLHDASSPRRPLQVDANEKRGLADVYRALDGAVAELMHAAGPEVQLTVVSDHGSGGASDKVLYLNRVLEEAGLLRMHPAHLRQTVVSASKELALTRLSAAVRQRLFRSAGKWLPNRAESMSRYGNIDMSKTRAFSDELNYFPAVHLNLAGREPQGTVRPEEVETVVREVRDTLLALRDPWSDKPVVRDVLRREQLYDGPWIDRAPDLLLSMHLDSGYSYNVMPTRSAPPGCGPFRKLAASEHLGRKGRSLPGSHRERGLWLVAGPDIRSYGRVEAKMADVPATLIHRLGVTVPSEWEGRVVEEALQPHSGVHQVLPPTETEREGADEADLSQVEARLRALGYIE